MAVERNAGKCPPGQAREDRDALLREGVGASLQADAPDTEMGDVDGGALLAGEGVLDDVLVTPDIAGGGRRINFFLLLILFLLCLAVAWRWLPLPENFGLQMLENFKARVIDDPALYSVVALGAFMIGGLIAVPVTVMIAGTGLLFGPVHGFAIAFVGANLSALGTYWLGGRLGGNTVRELGGQRVRGIREALKRRGMLTTLILRISPIAPFTLINLVAGALRISRRDFVLGTLAGMTPVMLAVLLLTDRLEAALRTPGAGSLLTLLITGALVCVLAAVLIRVLIQRLERR